MQEVLSPLQITQFIDQGFVRIDHAFSPVLAEKVRQLLWKDMDADPTNPSSWSAPVIRLGMYTETPFVQSANTPVLHAAFDQLLGAGRWLPCKSMGTFPIRFPSSAVPHDIGWHIDVSFGFDAGNYLEWRANWRSRGRGLLMLFLYSDIGIDDAPTRIKVGSHLDIARLLYPHGEEGLTLSAIVSQLPSLTGGEEISVIGNAGTVYLCHPFIVHAAQAHRGTTPRFLAQPPLLLKEDLLQRNVGGEISPVEAAILLGISR